MMKRNYPQEIEEQAIALEQITRRRDEAREKMEEVTDLITRDVLNMVDAETGKLRFTNDKARDLAIRERQRASGEYQKWATIAANAEISRAEAAARLERLRGEFSLSKIERRERIAAIDAAIG